MKWLSLYSDFEKASCFYLINSASFPIKEHWKECCKVSWIWLNENPKEMNLKSVLREPKQKSSILRLNFMVCIHKFKRHFQYSNTDAYCLILAFHLWWIYDPYRNWCAIWNGSLIFFREGVGINSFFLFYLYLEPTYKHKYTKAHSSEQLPWIY